VGANAQQININRVELMPNIPSPYVMRDWKNVAAGYDSLVFDLNRIGLYLPLSWINNSPINYPEHSSFGLHTVVGTTSPFSAEGINLIPAVIGASLSGIDKSNQNGYNWVLMCEEHFNKANNANVYLNHPTGSPWDDWWYDVMPNIFFYQLYDQYPSIGDFSNQFPTVANRWLDAVRTMGGSTTPWQIPYMNYRAFNLMTMTPFASGVIEPEAAGALAWILYNAYVETENENYRIGAEWCMEFLNSLTSNPSYELQLSYGAYTAARMNAELGTTYNISKIINWCFDVGPLRQWGAILGTWGGYDVDGLIGEVNGTNDYAFLMNTFEQVGALVPLVRYDDRYARAIGKWVLNAANAARLLYTNYLPDNHQDSEVWAHIYDPNSYIGYEALRQEMYGNSPYATGDAISGGWGATNLALYGSSHVGILGGIIDTTNVLMILKLDLLKTDYFHKDAFPSFLYYNPYSSEKSVIIDVGNEARDIYDAASSAKIKSAVTGETSIVIPADAAVIAVIIPAGSTITFDLDQAFVDGVVIDYLSGQTVANYTPRIKSLASDLQVVVLNDSAKIYCTSIDKDSDPLTYQWSVTGGSFSGTGSVINWLAPSSPGTFTIACNVSDGKGGTSSDSISIEAVEYINNDPIITGITADPRKIHLSSESEINCSATDPDGDTLDYNWSAIFGIISGTGATITWTAPTSEGNYYITCVVNDGRGGEAIDSIGVSVRDTTIQQTGDLVAFYPFSGNANDASGFNNNGTVSGAILTTDRWGNTASAYSFDGINDNIRVLSSPSLNFQNSVTINFWIKVGEFYDREAYPLSHGNWENRWKVSITNKHIRWTVKTNDGIKDLDSETELVLNNLYNVTVLYDSSDYEIYINGELDAFTSFSGLILTTPIDLMIGQVLPDNTQYNFKGVLDDIRIYNYALSYSSIQSLNDFISDVQDEQEVKPPKNFGLAQNYPNPFNSQTNIEFQLPSHSSVKLEIFNILGQKIKTLLDEEKSPGYYTINWNGKNDFGNSVNSGIYFIKFSSDKFSDIKKMTLMK
ncbi:MAG: T9SS type A sorting domain-containing protein, partial [Ignavibacteriaceae bacterium]|nr:T9SS type A sorting domain-containing protein [Ignavibacteriaceae bacterium]